MCALGAKLLKLGYVLAVRYAEASLKRTEIFQIIVLIISINVVASCFGGRVNGLRPAVIELDRRSKHRGDEEGSLTIPRLGHCNLQPSASENMVSASRPCIREWPFRDPWLLVADIHAGQQGMPECEMQTGHSPGLSCAEVKKEQNMTPNNR